MAEKSISIVVAGSSPAVTEDLLEIAKSIANEDISWLKADRTDYDYATADLIVCGPLRVEAIAQHVQRDKIIALDTTPATPFFVQLAALAQGSKVHIFNNTKAWCDLTVKQCRQVGISHLDFVLVPYEEMKQPEVIAHLQAAQIIIGKGNMVGAGGALDQYRQYLSRDIRVMAMERTATVETIKDCIKKITIARYLRVCQEVVAIINHLNNKSLAVKTAVDEISHSIEMNMQGIRELSDNSQEENQRVIHVSRVSEQLEATVKNIGSISDTIKGISGQTRLLALNASIEAARAGSEGRGFAVVAREVGALAAETDTSTKHIRQHVGDIQRSVTELSTELAVLTKSVEHNFQQTAVFTDRLDDESTKLQQIFASLDEINEVGIKLGTVADTLLTQ